MYYKNDKYKLCENLAIMAKREQMFDFLENVGYNIIIILVKERYKCRIMN
jgi:hypothetical protein